MEIHQLLPHFFSLLRFKLKIGKNSKKISKIALFHMKRIVILDQILSKTIIFILPSHWSDPPTLAGVIWTFLFLVKIFIILTYFRWAFLKWLKIVKKGPQNQNKWPWYEEKTLIFQFSSKKHVIRISILHTSKSPLSVVLKVLSQQLYSHTLLFNLCVALTWWEICLKI